MWRSVIKSNWKQISKVTEQKFQFQNGNITSFGIDVDDAHRNWLNRLRTLHSDHQAYLSQFKPGAS